MPEIRLVRAAPVALAASLLLAWSGSALAGDADQSQREARTADSSPAVRGIVGGGSFSAQPLQHGGSDLHLPPTQQNIELVSKLEMNTPTEFRFDAITGDPDPSEPAVVPEQIADLAVYKGFAYLNSWDDPSCRRGGTFVVDIRNPAVPRQVGFIPSLENRYHGEGAHVITLNTPAFQGDVLAVNNEPYTNDCVADTDAWGGFDLYDVSNPLAPRPLVQGIGDTGPEGELMGSEETPKSSHSAFMWQGKDRRAYIVFVDNVESTDVDIYEITNPAQPRPVGEFDLDQRAREQGVDIVDQGGLGGESDVFLHDMVVKQIGDRFIMMADYWDAGYTTWDVTEPANPRYIADTTFDGADPLTGRTPTEGNGHQGEFSFDNRYILAADEDFSPYRPRDFQITTGPNAGVYESAPVGGGTAPGFLEDEVMNGPTVYGGYGCAHSAPIPPRSSIPEMQNLEPGEEAIVVLQRGPSQDPSNPGEPCFPGQKAENGVNAGYDAVLLVNHHAGEAGGIFCGSGLFPPGRPIVAICTSHAVLHTLFDEPNDTTVPVPPGHGPTIGDVGHKVEAASIFDGWGYTHLYRAQVNPTGGKQLMARLDSHAIEEALNPSYAFGFGDLSVHEFAADPTEYVAYSAYYAGGMRVFTFGDGGLTEQGKFIDQGGNNFWGVEQFTLGNQRYFAGSDRDYGLYIFRYTGPGAAQRPVCANTMAMVPYKMTGTVTLPCSDANAGNQVTRSVVTGPTAGTLSGNIGGGTATYTHTGGRMGTDRFTFKASDGALESEPATARVVAVPRKGGRCFNVFAGTARNERMSGSPFGDRIRGAGGRDRVRGRGGDDCLSGQSGRDRVAGDNGRDRVSGGSRSDRLYGGSSNDRLRGGRGNDMLRGGPGRDRLFGQAGADRLEAGAGRRHLLSAGAGNDRLFAVNGRRDRVRCGRGRDRVRADARDRVAGDCETVRRARRRN